ncbi:MAG: hypothetical protein JWP65_1273 [Ramlibacter sp.]|jgi:Ser/Thr protein kinase RdoA (MazF antagonist)|uniref:hypothetical protein n=1 Tax=Ramlibacter sp. TaxID=1917967 RepID=UPI0026282542|nr:hypothetical protein [Ramlibacter sp.]MDB5750852.1 hypothetical protein [Ramlibacter sp.]
MTRFIQADFPTEHAGITRFTRGFAAVRQLDATLTRLVLAVLTFIGAPLRQVGAKVASRFAAWAVARQQRVDDDKLWALALTDARVMADLSRAMSAEARSVRSYY